MFKEIVISTRASSTPSGPSGLMSTVTLISPGRMSPITLIMPRPIADGWGGYRPRPYDQAQPAHEGAGSATHRSRSKGRTKGGSSKGRHDEG
eukprot:308521-Heterocapsa_arctica.AAC.1